MTDLTVARAEQWRALQPRRWRPWQLGPVLVWVVLVVLATTFADEGGCTRATPCGPLWWDSFETALGMAAPFVLLLAPVPGIWLSAVAGALFVVTEWGPQDQPRPFVVLFAVALALATADATRRRHRRSARASELLGDVDRGTWPGPPPVLELWSLRVRVAVGLVALGAGVLVWGVQHGQGMAEREAQAPRVQATVVGHGHDGYLVDLEAAGERYEVDSLDAEDYPVGSTQELVVDGTRVTLAVERYDPSWSLALALALALLGGCLAWRAREHRRAVAALLGTPQPVHRVRLGAAGDAQVLPVDGPIDVLPLVGVPVAADLESDDSDLLEADEPAVLAQLYGVPLRGAWCAAVLEDGTRLLPAGPVRRPELLWADVARRADAGDVVGSGIEVPVDVREREVALSRPQPWRRLAGAAVVAGAVVGGLLAAREPSGLGTTLWRCAIAATFLFEGLVLLAGKVTLTDDGLVHEGPTTRRTVPWAAVTDVSVVDDVVLLHLHLDDDDDVLPLTWLPRRPLWALKGARNRWAQDWAAVLVHRARSAERAPEARVVEEPRLTAAVGAIVLAAAVVIGAQVRP